MLVAILSDRFRHRFLFAMIPICIAITGFAILMNVHHDTHTEYAALFLITSGTYSAMPIIVCWFTMNLGGHHRRSVGSAWQIGAGNVSPYLALCFRLSLLSYVLRP
jgi:predicted MFS family arabinose efflux permease